jgi:hypothetical protein
MPPSTRLESLYAESPYENGLTPEQELAHVISKQFAEKLITPRVRSFDEWGNPVG